jgi:hypothetical protein
VSLSATIAPEDTRAVVTGAVEIDVSVKKPDVMWLKSPVQLGVLGTRFREVLRAIRDHMPNCQRIHLFYAGPTGGAITIGQQVNPRMNPPVETYEYSRQWNPRYRRALTLHESRSADRPGESVNPSPVDIAATIGSTPKRVSATPGSGASGKAATVIQFVAGDRGGGPRSQVQVPREEKGIREAIALGPHRDAFEFAHPVLAASLDDFIACHRAEPAILHFVGHGEERRMVLVRDRDVLVETMSLEPDQLETLLRAFPSRVRLVVFNTCRSLELARHIAARGAVDLSIGIEGLIPDDHAIRFAVTFYARLAEGLTVQAAFDLAGLQLGDLGEASRPQLFCAEGVRPDRVTFAGA